MKKVTSVGYQATRKVTCVEMAHSRHPSPVTRHATAFTLIEIMVATAILGMIVAAIYTSWIAIIKGRAVGVAAAAAAQRERMSIRVIEEALMSAQLFAENANLYSFVAENGTSDASLSFVSRLTDSFPRSGKFEGFNVRRCTFLIEAGRPSSSGSGSENRLVLRQNPILLEADTDEMENPIVLARNVKEFKVEFWDTRLGDWVDEWRTTNQLPKLVKVFLSVNRENQKGYQSSKAYDEVTRIIGLPSAGVPSGWQTPPTPPAGAPGRPNPGNPRQQSTPPGGRS